MVVLTANEAYKRIHESLANAVLAMIDDCNYAEAIKYSEMMEKIEANKLEVVTEMISVDGTTQSYFVG